MKYLFSRSWWAYFFSSNLLILKRTLFKRKNCKLTFRSASRIGLLVFSLTINLLIAGPVLLGSIILFNTGHFEPGLLVVSAFGIFFGIFIRSIIDDSLSFISYDGNCWYYESFALHSLNYQVFVQSDISGITLYEYKNIDRFNYKVALKLRDDRLILLYVSQIKSWSLSVFNKTKSMSQLNETSYEGQTPINDMNIGKTNPY